MELRGEKVLIRPLVEEDAALALAYLQENRAFLEHWEPHRDDSWFTVEAQRREIAAAAEDRAADRGYAFGVFAGGELAGRLGLSQVFRGSFQNAYLGYSIAERWNGHGFATEAVGLVLRFAFEEAGLHRLQAAVMPRNAGSIRVLEKNGFREEGYAVRYLCINGAWEDHRIFARTRDREPASPSRRSRPRPAHP
jgi:[ribosomal protein S5]-alanine N-acetyltransferase